MTIKIFVLRYGACALTLGAAVRRLEAEENKRIVKGIDGCHLTSQHRGTLLDIQLLADNEILLDSFSVDAENESTNAW